MKVISFDGGGIRGLISLYYLKKLLAVKPNLVEQCDFFAGTSTGGIIALGLASGRTVDDMINLYEEKGAKIFKDSVFDNFTDAFGLAGAQYSNAELKKVLREAFGEKTIKDLKKKVLIPAFSIDSESVVNRSWGPVFFDNFNSDSDDEKLWEVALRTSAAPTFFPIYQKYADGGLFANNPTMCAIAQVSHVKDLEVISFGCGKNLIHIEKRNCDWGLASWGKYLIDVIFAAGVDTIDYQARKFVGDSYLRVNPLMEQNFPLDGVKHLKEMKKYMDEYPLEGMVAEYLENYWKD